MTLFLLQLFFIFILKFVSLWPLNSSIKPFPTIVFKIFYVSYLLEKHIWNMFLFLLCRTFEPFHGSQTRSKIVYLCLYFRLFFLLMFFILKPSGLLCTMYSIMYPWLAISTYSIRERTIWKTPFKVLVQRYGIVFPTVIVLYLNINLRTAYRIGYWIFWHKRILMSPCTCTLVEIFSKYSIKIFSLISIVYFIPPSL